MTARQRITALFLSFFTLGGTAPLTGCDAIDYGPGGTRSKVCKDGYPRNDSRHLKDCEPVQPLSCTTVDDCAAGGNKHVAVCQKPAGAAPSDQGVCRGWDYAPCATTSDCTENYTCRGTSAENYGVCLPETPATPPDMGMTMPDPTCQQNKNCPVGNLCAENTDCSSGLCQGTCRVPVTGSCTQNAECANNLTCSMGTCRQSLHTMCTANAQCLSNLCDSNQCLSDIGGTCSQNSDCKSAYCTPGAGARTCGTPMLPACMSNALDSGSACGNDQSNTTCLKLPLCGADRWVKGKNDCDTAKAPQFAGTDTSDGVCAGGPSNMYYLVSAAGDGDRMHHVGMATMNYVFQVGSFVVASDPGIRNIWAIQGGGDTGAGTAATTTTGTGWLIIAGKGYKTPFYKFSGGTLLGLSKDQTPP